VEISKLNINTATAEQFMALKGIGKKKAEAIIAWRTEHGGFKSVEQLAEVNGISERFVTEHQTELTLD
jgi:competence protein ComEA